jgi:hypothetical protein
MRANCRTLFITEQQTQLPHQAAWIKNNEACDYTTRQPPRATCGQTTKRIIEQQSEWPDNHTLWHLVG